MNKQIKIPMIITVIRNEFLKANDCISQTLIGALSNMASQTQSAVPTSIYNYNRSARTTLKL